jgi:hypothetical protein
MHSTVDYGKPAFGPVLCFGGLVDTDITDGSRFVWGLSKSVAVRLIREIGLFMELYGRFRYGNERKARVWLGSLVP